MPKIPSALTKLVETLQQNIDSASEIRRLLEGRAKKRAAAKTLPPLSELAEGAMQGNRTKFWLEQMLKPKSNPTPTTMDDLGLPLYWNLNSPLNSTITAPSTMNSEVSDWNLNSPLYQTITATLANTGTTMNTGPDTPWVVPGTMPDDEPLF
jgi:hypothetical protein